ncbi:MAG: tol-pal system protein YbgF [Pseudomonadota bacterium]
MRLAPFKRNQAALLSGCLSLILTTGVQAAAPVVDLTSKPSGSQPYTAPMTTEQRLQRLERLLDSQNLVELARQVQMLQQDVQQLRGLMEEKGYETESMKQRQRELYLDTDRRLSNLERALNDLRAPAATSHGEESGGMAPPPAEGGGPESASLSGGAGASSVEATTYQNAFAALKQGDYDRAIGGFKTVLAQYPKGPYADNAQYWLGECYYVTRRFDEAATEFRKVLGNPESQKRSDAMLKLGFSYYEQKNLDEARKTLEQVVAEFPSSSVARLAEKRLQDLRAAGN